MRTIRGLLLLAAGLVAYSTAGQAAEESYFKSTVATSIKSTNTPYRANWSASGLPASGAGRLISRAVNYAVNYQTPPFGTVQVRICQDRVTDECTAWDSVTTGSSPFFIGENASFPFYLEARLQYSTTVGLTSYVYQTSNASLTVYHTD